MSRFDPAACNLLFHGTIEPLKGPLHPGGYDGLFWTAESSAVAQTYIPATGASVYASVNKHQLDQGVRPSQNNPLYALALAIGPAPLDVEWDNAGRAKSWRLPEGYATHRQVAQHIENVLGYKSKNDSGDPASGDALYELLTDGWDANGQLPHIVPANFKKTGSLIIVTGHQTMRFFDMSVGESDLTAVQHHSLGAFAKAREQGFDGVVIDDFCQTKGWGNVGHRSIGFFDTALKRLQTTVIPATRFEWGKGDEGGLSQRDTPEFTAWSRAQEAQKSVGLASKKSHVVAGLTIGWKERTTC